ncbi:hypothetical protein ACFQHO_39615 [Actinomadura yumaensis]
MVQLDNLGVHFGHRYSGSPVVWPADGTAPAWSWDRVDDRPWPGGRLPSIRLPGGDRLFDRLGPGFTLVGLTDSAAGDSLVAEAERRRMPLTCVPCDIPAVRAAWGCDLVLVRPDQHVAWQGGTAERRWSTILDRVCGR